MTGSVARSRLSLSAASAAHVVEHRPSFCSDRGEDTKAPSAIQRTRTRRGGTSPRRICPSSDCAARSASRRGHGDVELHFPLHSGRSPRLPSRRELPLRLWDHSRGGSRRARRGSRRWTSRGLSADTDTAPLGGRRRDWKRGEEPRAPPRASGSTLRRRGRAEPGTNGRPWPNGRVQGPGGCPAVPDDCFGRHGGP